jgi:hypothetical protein
MLALLEVTAEFRAAFSQVKRDSGGVDFTPDIRSADLVDESLGGDHRTRFCFGRVDLMGD